MLGANLLFMSSDYLISKKTLQIRKNVKQTFFITTRISGGFYIVMGWALKNQTWAELKSQVKSEPRFFNKVRAQALMDL